MNKKSIIGILITALILGAVIYQKNRSTSESSAETKPKVKDEASVSADAQDVAAPSKVSTLTEKEKEQLEEIQNELTEAKSELPTIEDLREFSGEEVHHTPAILLKSGKLIGRLISEADAEPLRREATVKYFLDCAENSELPQSVRAVCWKATMNQIPKWRVFVPISGAKVPNEVKELATRLP